MSEHVASIERLPRAAESARAFQFVCTCGVALVLREDPAAAHFAVVGVLPFAVASCPAERVARVRLVGLLAVLGGDHAP